jgi:hypothetical protein
MPEILTESFCERCGTRYTFESAAPRANRLKGVKVLSRGLKNFVMSDDTSLDEAMAAARSDTDREVTSQQLDAFHKTFNFCMQCRQYTCANCWNEADGRCLTCAPHLGHEILEAPFPDLAASPQLDLRAEPNGNGANGYHDPSLEALAWPTSDLLRDEGLDDPAPDAVDAMDSGPEIEPIDAAARLAALGAVSTVDEPVVDETVETPPVAAVPAPGDDPVAASAAAAPAPTPPVAADPDASEIDRRAAAAAAATASLLRSFRPGQSLDAALEAYEREQAGEPAESPDAHHDAAVPAAAIGAAAIVEQATPDGPDATSLEGVPETELSPEPAHDHAAAAAAAALAAAALHTPDAPDAPTPAAPAPPTDRVEQPTWRIVAPDAGAPGAADPIATPPIAASAEPQWPAQPEWPSRASSSAGLPFLGRPAAATGGIEALWAESAREVASVPTSGPAALGPLAGAKAAGGVQPCVSCGLSLSATARFCRRCGSRQG